MPKLLSVLATLFRVRLCVCTFVWRLEVDFKRLSQSLFPCLFQTGSVPGTC